MSKTVNPQSRPLYQRVVDDITAQVGAGTWKAGDKLPSEHALCERYAVSQITVRRALRELAHVGRVYSRHGLGWFVSAESAPTESAEDVAFILPGMDWFTARLVQGVSEAVDGKGVALRLAFTGGKAEAEAQAVSAAVARGASALLLLVSGEERRLGPRYSRLLADIEVPTLLLVRDVPGVSAPSIVLEERLCLEQTTRHILGLGHRRVAYVGSDPALAEGQRRYQGFAATLWDHGLELPLDWVFSGPLTQEATAARFHRAFSAADRPTAVVCASDMRAAEAIYLLHSMMLNCPQDVAVVGAGDCDFSSVLMPPLTTFRFDLPALGRTAARQLLDLLAGHTVESARISGHLVARQSCGAGLPNARRVR